MTAPVDPSFLASLGQTPQAAAEHLRAEAERFAAEVQKHREDWLEPISPGRWSPAQLAEHLLLANSAFGKVVHLLASEKPVPDVPRTPATLIAGKVVAPPHLVPGPGLPWSELEGGWREAHARFLEAARQPNDPARTFWHPVFGQLDALGWTRAAAWHTRHHRKQLS